MTRVISVHPTDPDEAAVGPAATALRAGGLVAFPTETVYGLGADATNGDAVARVYRAKGRPAESPLIVHVAAAEDAWSLAAEVPPAARVLAGAFWPGPLTLVLRLSRPEVAAACGGGDTIALRAPDHAVALSLLRLADRPIAAPSANVTGRVSPVTAQHVLADLEGKVDIVLDGGRCPLGLESTVLDLTAVPARVLRPGAVETDALRRLIGEVDGGAAPGASRYQPRAELVLVLPTAAGDALAAQIERLRAEGRRVGLACSEETAEHTQADVTQAWGPRDDPDRIARRLYEALRRLDGAGVEVIVAEGLAGERFEGIMHRLRSAAARVVPPASRTER